MNRALRLKNTLNFKDLRDCISLKSGNGNQLVIHADFLSYNGEIIEHPDTKIVFEKLRIFLDDCGLEVGFPREDD